MSASDEVAWRLRSLEARLQRPVDTFAYPYGYSSRRVRLEAARAGYVAACSVGNRMVDGTNDVYALNRLTIRKATGIADFERLVHGRGVARLFLPDRTLTRGYAALRHARALLDLHAPG